MVLLKVRQWGDRLALVIPPEVARQEGILAGDVLVVKLRKRRTRDLEAAPAQPRNS
ncbi:MAG TPA: AbrB/MazE/SpoVT family DNA-binding domain-containing protein [Candidatus Thermoplasmatota archaeon]|nr:AbrB/MazE/SpoVT family DNA-binding domain-containing protein [Candidatus Thermoplasmatota archaeon]